MHHDIPERLVSHYEELINLAESQRFAESSSVSSISHLVKTFALNASKMIVAYHLVGISCRDFTLQAVQSSAFVRAAIYRNL